MVKYFSALLLCCALCTAADKLAVAEPTAKGGVTAQEVEALWGMLEASVGGFEVISRSALKQILAEIGFTDSSGLADPSPTQKSRLGEIKTVKYILVSEISRLGSRYNVNLLLLDSSTGTLDPNKRVSVTVNNFDEFSDKLPDSLREAGLGRPAVMSGRAALLNPVIKSADTPAYLRDHFNARMQAALLENGIRLYQLQDVRRILNDNKIGALDEAEPAMYARIGELLRADCLILPEIITFTTRIDRRFVKASNRTVVKCIGDLNGSVKIINAKTGDMVAAIPFRNRIDFSDLDDDMSDWTPEDYGIYLIEATLKPLAPQVLDKLKTKTE